MALPLSADPRELERRLRAVEPAVRVVPERHIRRVLHLLHDAGDERVLNPALPVWVSAEFLRQTDALAEETLAGAAGVVLLLSAPDDRSAAREDDQTVLRHYWRLLVRAAVLREGRLTTAEIARRLESVPPEFVAEVRFVLESDHVIRRGAPTAELYLSFAATCAELLAFDPGRLHDVYPSAPAPGEMTAVLSPNVDVDRLAERLRPDGAATQPAVAETEPLAPAPQDADAADAEDSDRLARLGNYTRAAVKRLRASRHAGGAEKRQLEQAARSVIRNGLAKGVGRVLGLDDDQTEAWYRAMWPLVAAASEGTWPHAARALYDLQRLAAELRGRLYAVTPVEWLLSFGRHPIRRNLHRARDVILHARLGRVEQHVLRSHLSDADRERLLSLLHAQMAVAEGRIRRDLGPVIRDVFDRVGLEPTSLPERVARDKVVAELLDRVCERGFLRISDLRDAIARNQLKLPDLSGPGEFVRGDALLRADVRLADELFGVYHRGEIYLRWIQRFSAAAFGTPPGRFVTKYLALPFGGAFLALEFFQHVLHGAEKAGGVIEKLLVPETPTLDVEGAADAVQHVTAPPAHHEGVALVTGPSVLVLGVVLLALIHSPAVRNVAVRAARVLWKALGYVFLELPLAVWRSPPVRAVRRSAAVRLFNKYLGPAFLFTAATVLVLIAAGAPVERMLRWGGIVFLGSTIVSNTPFGRRVRDSAAEAVSDTWRVLWINLIPGVVAWFVWAFRELLGALDRMLYAVDEKLRYREGASRPSVALRAVLAVAWFPIAYVVRFAFYLLLEPQVNPIKHFPVVTVSHKVMLPLIQPLADGLNISLGLATAIISGVPGIFGFLVWELKENWRLYAANRPPTLRPVPIGHHGETGRGLLRPGFHSGTVPKLYRKLRAGWLDGGHPPPERHAKAHHELHHIEVALRRLCERDVFPLWAAVGSTAGLRPDVRDVHLGCQHVSIRIGTESDDPNPVVVMCRNGPGGISGEVTSWGWASALGPEQQAVIRTGVEGLLALAAARPGSEPAWEEWVEFWSKRETGG